MKKKRVLIISSLIVLGLLGIYSIISVFASPSLGSGAPTVVSYQGVVKDSGTPYDGTGYFKFAVVNTVGNTSYWSNDGTSTVGDEPTAGVSLTVDEGLFQVLLGDTGLTNMTSLPASAFSGTGRYLRVWFSSDNVTYTVLSPDQQFAAVPYAFQAQEAEVADALSSMGTGSGLDADMVDGLHASELETHYQNVVIVAKSGGDYTTVQAAIDSITDAAASNPYLVWVAPGVYSESVTMKSHVHLQGAGQEATIITSSASNSSFPLTQATLILASDTSLRDLSLENSGIGNWNIAMLGSGAVVRTLVSDVSLWVHGSGVNNYSIFLVDSGTDVILQEISAVCENGTSDNYGLYNYDGAVVSVHASSFIANGGDYAYGIYNAGNGTILETEIVTAWGKNGSTSNYGLLNIHGAEAMVHGGYFTASGGNLAFGIYNRANNTKLVVVNSTVLGEIASSGNYGLYIYDNAEAILRGGSYTGRGGGNSFGISNNLSGSTLETESVSASGENGTSNNYGLYNNAEATLRGGAFTGSGGTSSYGIYNNGSGARLETEAITALGENGTDENYGLQNFNGAEAILNGDSFAGSSGSTTYGVYNSGSGTILEGEGILVRGWDGSDDNYGLYNKNSAAALLQGGSFSGSGGSDSYGIYNSDSGTTLEAVNISALGENGSSSNSGLYNISGSAITLLGGNIRADGGTITYGISNYGSSTTLDVTGSTVIGVNASTNHGLFNYEGSAALRGGSFTGRGGSDSYGIWNRNSSATLETESITALGEDGTSENWGLNNYNGATAILHGGSFSANGGSYADGIYNQGTSVLEATNITALAENGSIENYGLNQGGGTMSLGVTQLAGGVNWSGGSRTCFQVYDGSYAGITCP